MLQGLSLCKLLNLLELEFLHLSWDTMGYFKCKL